MGQNSVEKKKPLISAEHAINWYLGNYLSSPNNALRDEEEKIERIHEEMEKVKIELGEKRLTHREFLELVKEKGIHAKYYRYEKAKPSDCPLCRLVMGQE